MFRPCESCSKDIDEVAQYHEENGHTTNHEYRLDLLPHTPGLCEDCRDDILEDMIS